MKDVIRKYFLNTAQAINQERRRLLVSEVKKISPKKVIDLGCGNTELTEFISKEAGLGDVSGVDLYPVSKKSAKKRHIKFYRSDLNRKLRLKRSQYDLIVSVQTIEHLVDLDTFMLEAKRILKKGGKMIITTENLSSWHNIFALFTGNQPYSGPFISRRYLVGNHPLSKNVGGKKWKEGDIHISVMTLKALIFLLKRYGFETIKVYGIGYYPLPFVVSKMFSKLDPYHSAVSMVIVEKV